MPDTWREPGFAAGKNVRGGRPVAALAIAAAVRRRGVSGARWRFLFRPAEERAGESTVAPGLAAYATPHRGAAAHGRDGVAAGWLELLRFAFIFLRVLRLQAVIDPVKSELDALDFGTLCHAALEAMGGSWPSATARTSGAHPGISGSPLGRAAESA